MLALVGTVMSRSASGNVLLRDGDGVLGTHTVSVHRPPRPIPGCAWPARSPTLRRASFGRAARPTPRPTGVACARRCGPRGAARRRRAVRWRPDRPHRVRHRGHRPAARATGAGGAGPPESGPHHLKHDDRAGARAEFGAALTLSRTSPGRRWTAGTTRPSASAAIFARSPAAAGRPGRRPRDSSRSAPRWRSLMRRALSARQPPRHATPRVDRRVAATYPAQSRPGNKTCRKGAAK